MSVSVLVVGAAAVPAQAPASGSATVDHRATVASVGDFDRLAAVARREGEVRVIVGLQARFVPEGTLSKGETRAQRSAIASATADLRRVLGGTTFTVNGTYRSLPYVAMTLSPGALERLRSSKRAASLEPNRILRLLDTESARIVEAAEGVPVGLTGAGQHIAVLDSGIDKDHPWMQLNASTPKVVSEACYSFSANCPGGVTSSTAAGSGAACTFASNCDHGTHVAGIAAGKSAAGYSSVAREARLISIRVVSNQGGVAAPFQSDMLKGLERVYALRDTFPIAAVNLSVGGGSPTNVPCEPSSFQTAIDLLESAGIATVIAAGNEGSSAGVDWPACVPTAIAVGSTNKDDAISSFSNSGSLLDLWAPGGSITSSVPGGGLATHSGTSMAAPHVAGAWAVIKQAKPQASVADVLAALQNTGVPITDSRNGITRDRIRVFSARTSVDQSGMRVGQSFVGRGTRIASSGIGLWNAGSATGGSITLTGIPSVAKIEQASLVWMRVGAGDPNVWFNSSLLAQPSVGTLVGGAANPCQGTNHNGATRVYRLILPAGRVTGDGTYSTLFLGPNVEGASLVVVYSLPVSNRIGHVYLRFGAVSGKAGETMRNQFSGLSVPAPPVTRGLHVGIADAQGPSPAMRFSNVALTPPNFWTSSDGNYWDDATLAVPSSTLPVGADTRTNTQLVGTDCLAWAYAGLEYATPDTGGGLTGH